MFSRTHTLLTLLVLLIGVQGVFAQKERPLWTDGYFYDADYSYVEVASATGWEINDARQKAYQEIINRRSMATGTNAKVVINGDNASVKSQHDLIVKSRIVDEYVEQLEPGLYKVYLLVQTAKNPTFSYENVAVTDKYPVSARIIVPGWAQFYKGSNLKGGLIVAGEVVGVAGIVTCYSLKASYENLIKLDPKHTNTYLQYSDACSNVGYGFIALTAALYVYNLIDGAVARGKKRVFIENQLTFAPTYSPENNSFGLAMKMNF